MVTIWIKFDAVKRDFFGGKFEEETIEGWGYSEKLQVKYHRTIESGKLDESATKEQAENLVELAPQKP